ncbi:MAG: nucleotidyltransferase family protein [Tateyamaria sp.]|uniref:nucleotidyltransferase family protein n=1 Tax=Tateyamaria sp. TaxID=1929288 RepID=UPI00329D7356
MMPVLILAAGASSRMRGRDKLRIAIDGVPLLRRQAKMALHVSTDVRIALPPRPHPRYDLVKDLTVDCIEVTDAAEGMGASLRALFATLESDVSAALILLGDLPDVDTDDLRSLMAAMHTHSNALIWRCATPSGKAGHPMIVARGVFDDFKALSGDSGGQAILKAAGDALYLVPLKDERARRDLDTPEDWAAWEAARKKPLT